MLQILKFRHHIYFHNSLFWHVFRLLNLILIPLFKKASSLIFFCKIAALNLIDEKISFEGRKFIFVPDRFVFFKI